MLYVPSKGKFDMDIIQSLRRLEFPEYTQFALEHLAACCNLSPASIPGLASTADEIADQLILEFIFCQASNKSRTQSKRIGPLQELQVVRLILEFLNQRCSDDAMRYSLFQAIFSAGSVDRQIRSRIFSKLISLAIGVGSGNVLDSAALWMQMHPSESDLVVVMLDALINDYCNTCTGVRSKFYELPKISEHFACNLLTAMISCLQLPGAPSRGTKRCLNLALVEMIADWLIVNPQLGLISFNRLRPQFVQSQQRSTLWNSTKRKWTVQSPIPGLVRWCAMSSLIQAMSQRHSFSHNEDVLSLREMESGERRWAAAWSRIHLAVLQTLVQFQFLPDSFQQELFTLADMQANMKDIAELLNLLPSGVTEDSMTAFTDLLLHHLQVALATGAIRCSHADLLDLCRSLPTSRLLEMIRSRHRVFNLPTTVG